MSLSRYAAIVMALAAAMVLTRLLDEEVYGAYRKVWLLYGVLGPAFVNTLAGTLYYRAKTGARDTVLSVNLALGLSYGVLTALIGGLFAGFWASQLNITELETAFRYFALYMGLSVFAGIAEPLFVSIRRKKWLVGYSITYNIVEFFLIVVPFYLGMDIPTVFLIMSAGPAIRVLLLVILALRHIDALPSRPVFWAELSQSMAYGKGIFLLTIAAVAAVQVDKWVIGIFFEDDARYAVYEIGAKKIPFITALTAAVGASIVSEYADKLRAGAFAGAQDELRKVSSRLSLLLIPAVVVLFVFAEEVLFVLFGGYRDSAPVFRIYLLTVLTQLFFPHSILLGLGRSDITARYSVVEFGFNLVLSILLVSWIGLAGPAWATMLAHVLYIVLLFMYCKKQYDMSPSRIMPGKALLPLLVSMPILGFAAVALKYGAGFIWPGFILTTLVAGATGLFHVWKMKNW